MLHLEKLTDSITSITALDPKLRVFDIVMNTEFGTTYNSYLVRGAEEYALIDTAKEKYFDEYLELLKKEVGKLEKIKYLIVNHTEPDHSGEIGKLLAVMPWLKVVGTPVALGFLKEIANCEFEQLEVKEGFTLNVGGRILKFVIAPNLHWPDSMFSYVEDEGILFTCDVFGAHYCSDCVYLDKVEKRQEYDTALKYYFDCIFGPFKAYVLDGLRKIEGLDLKFIAPSHGQIITSDIEEIKRRYKEWSCDVEVEEDKIAITHVSAYGYTTRIAEEIKTAIEEEGFRVVLVDLLEKTPGEALHELNTSAAYLIGSPTLNGDTVPPVWELLLQLDIYKNNGKLTGAFGSFGWSGEAVRNIESRLSQIKSEVYRPGLRLKFNPNDKTKLEKARIFGTQFAKKLLTLRTNKNSEWAQIKTGKWKCLVCGEIFEGEYPPETCPTCGAPSDQFIELKDELREFRSESEETIVIIGSGIGAMTAAETIRKYNTKCQIHMISEDTQMPYYRIQLSKILCTEQSCTVKGKKWFEDLNVIAHFGKKVEQVLAQENKLLLNDSTDFIYDKLIIATGARARMLPIHGSDKEGVFMLRHLEDFKAINSRASREEVRKVAIVGGGILGVEIAAALKKAGKEVAIVETAPRLMNRLIDDDAATLFQSHLEKNGVEIYLSESVEEIYGTGQDFKDVCGLRLSHAQETLGCQMVIIAAGVIPNVEFLKDSKITLNKGIVVNEYMQSNVENIFACGDVAEFNGRMMGLWSAALEQGAIAASSALGNFERPYILKPIATTFNGFGYNVFSIGDFGSKEESSKYQVLELKDPQTEVYRKFYFLDNQFVGGILMGNTEKSSQMRRSIDKGTTMQSFLDSHFLDE